MGGDYILGRGKGSRLTQGEEAALARRIQAGLRSGADSAEVADGRQAEALMVEANRGLAFHVARKFTRTGIDREDAVNMALIGLLMAARSYDPGRGLRFSAIAKTVIVRTLRREVAATVYTIRIPHRRFGASKSESDDASARDLDARRAARVSHVRDMSRLIGTMESVVDAVAERDEQRHRSRIAAECLGILGQREADVVCRYLGLDGHEPLNFKQIGKALGGSGEGARLTYQRAVEAMRRKVGVSTTT